MFDRRCGRRFNVRSCADGSLRVVRDVYLARHGPTWNALGAEWIAPGEPLTLAVRDAHRHRIWRVIVRDIRTLMDGPDTRYELSLQPAVRRRAVGRER